MSDDSEQRDQQKRGSDVLPRIESIARTLSLVLIPVVVALLGALFNDSLAKRDSRKAYVDIAITILREPQKYASTALSAWAADVLKQNSPTPISDAALNDLISGRVSLPASTVVGKSISRFAEFADRYDQSLPQMLAETLKVSIRTDSVVLATMRETVTDPNERLAAIETSRELIRGRYEILLTLRDHARLLGTYFRSLQVLSLSEGESGIGDTVKALLDELAKISPIMSSTTIGDAAVADFYGSAADIQVAQFWSKPLTRELERSAQSIDSQLALQVAVLKAVRASMEADLQLLAAQEEQNVVEPFVAAAPLPADWVAKRVASMGEPQFSRQLDDTIRLAENLRLGFVALAENRFDDSIFRFLEPRKEGPQEPGVSPVSTP